MEQKTVRKLHIRKHFSVDKFHIGCDVDLI